MEEQKDDNLIGKQLFQEWMDTARNPEIRRNVIGFFGSTSGSRLHEIEAKLIPEINRNPEILDFDIYFFNENFLDSLDMSEENKQDFLKYYYFMYFPKIHKLPL